MPKTWRIKIHLQGKPVRIGHQVKLPPPRSDQLRVSLREVYAYIYMIYRRYPKNDEQAKNLYLAMLKAQGFKGSMDNLYFYTVLTPQGFY